MQRGGSVLATVIKNIFKANVVVMKCKMFGEKKQGMAAVGGDYEYLLSDGESPSPSPSCDDVRDVW